MNQLMSFEKGKKYTLFSINSMLAMTSKREIEIKDLDDSGNSIFVNRGKRKKFIMRLETRSYASAPLKPLKAAVFEGWDQPFTCDTEFKSLSGINHMRGNACYNFIGMPESIRLWIEKGQLNPNFEKDHVLAINNNEGDGVVVFPEKCHGGHAVIDRLLKV